jgi:hypothetical protein
MGKLFVADSRESARDEVEGAEAIATIPWPGDYFFLFPDIQRLQQATGELIDPQSDAFFAGPAMDALAAFVQACKARTASQPDTWRQRVGTTGPTHEVVYETAHRARLLEFLEGVDFAIRRAREGRKGVFFQGE